MYFMLSVRVTSGVKSGFNCLVVVFLLLLLLIAFELFK